MKLDVIMTIPNLGVIHAKVGKSRFCNFMILQYDNFMNDEVDMLSDPSSIHRLT